MSAFTVGLSEVGGFATLGGPVTTATITATIRDRGHAVRIDDDGHTAVIRDRGHTVRIDDDGHTVTIRDGGHTV